MGKRWDMTHVLSSREDNSTDSEEAAMAAEPIQGCNTRPNGRKTPAVKGAAQIQIAVMVVTDHCI